MGECAHEWTGRLTDLPTVWIVCKHCEAHAYLGRYHVTDWIEMIARLAPDALTMALQPFLEERDVELTATEE
jgi:hypothetical protein